MGVLDYTQENTRCPEGYEIKPFNRTLTNQLRSILSLTLNTPIAEGQHQMNETMAEHRLVSQDEGITDELYAQTFYNQSEYPIGSRCIRSSDIKRFVIERDRRGPNLDIIESEFIMGIISDVGPIVTDYRHFVLDEENPQNSAIVYNNSNHLFGDERRVDPDIAYDEIKSFAEFAYQSFSDSFRR